MSCYLTHISLLPCRNPSFQNAQLPKPMWNFHYLEPWNCVFVQRLGLFLKILTQLISNLLFKISVTFYKVTKGISINYKFQELEPGYFYNFVYETSNNINIIYIDLIGNKLDWSDNNIVSIIKVTIKTLFIVKNICNICSISPTRISNWTTQKKNKLLYHCITPFILASQSFNF